MLPPWSFLGLYRRGGAKDLRTNLLWLIAAVGGVIAVTHLTDGLLAPQRRGAIATLGSLVITSNLIQWLAFGIVVYAVASWLQSLRLRDPVAHRLIATSPPFLSLAIGYGLLNIATYSVTAFNFVYANRYLHLQPRDGPVLGAILATASGTGLALGGVLGDIAKRHHPAGRIYFTMVAFSLFLIAALIQYTTASVTVFCIAYAVAATFSVMWMGCLLATGQDLVLPHMRGIAYAVLLLAGSVMGLGLGPYSVGLISDVTGDLRFGLLCVLGVIVPPSFLCLWFAARRLGTEEASVGTRAGESLAAVVTQGIEPELVKR